MWFKKHLLMVTVLAAMVILVTGIVGGVVYAQSGDTQTGSTSGKTLMARVATTLNIDQTKLEDAFAQAQKEIQKEEQTARLAKMVADGKLTQEQADQYQAWLESKPELPAGAGLEGDGGFRGGPRGMGPPPSLPTATPGTN
jgi:uncharacterized membrane protein